MHELAQVLDLRVVRERASAPRATKTSSGSRMVRLLLLLLGELEEVLGLGGLLLGRLLGSSGWRGGGGSLLSLCGSRGLGRGGRLGHVLEMCGNALYSDQFVSMRSLEVSSTRRMCVR